MEISRHTYLSVNEAHEALYTACQQAKDQGLRPVLIVKNSQSILNERRILAAAEQGFGVEVSTLPDWVENLWSLHGDSRVPIVHAVRIALAAKLIDEQSALPRTPGSVGLLARAAQNALVYRTRPAELVGNEIPFVELLNTYAQALTERNYCEYCEMLEYLCSLALSKVYKPILFNVEDDSLSAAEQAFVHALDACSLSSQLAALPSPNRSAELEELLALLFQRGGNDPAVEATGSLSCALSAGPTAEHRVIRDCIEDAVCHEGSSARIHVATKGPAPLFDYCAPLLKDTGMRVELSGSTTFDQTDAGRAILACLDLTSNAQAPSMSIDKLEAADYSYNPFAGMFYTSAFQADMVHRGDRLMPDHDVVEGLSSRAAEPLKNVLDQFVQQDYASALDAMQAFAKNAFAAQPVYQAAQTRAITIAREALLAAEAMNAPVQLVLESVANQPIGLHASIQGTTADAPTVRFTTLAETASLPEASIDAVVICNLDVDTYPVRARENAYTTLLEKWGAHVSSNPLLTQHRMLFGALAAAQSRVYLQRSLNDFEANPKQPAVLFEEVMDCYRASLEDYSDVDEHLGVAKSLVPYVLQAGEDSLTENASRIPQETAQELSWPPLGLIGADAKKMLVLPRDYHGNTYPGVDLSASQIESYLECPYQWFAKRRLRVEGIEEGFGAMERGTFIHNVLCAFYETFGAEVAPKVSASTLDIAHEILDRVFDDQVAYDPDRDPGRRYVPVSPWEEQLLADVRRQLHSSLVHEANLLPTFHPAYLEWDYGVEKPFSYAGCNLTGTIDRIDIDGKGNAVVIDYKTGNLADYSLLQNKDQQEFVLPHKVQTLIYAKVAQEELGLRVVGTIYYNPFSATVRGAYDARIIGPQDLLDFGKTVAACNQVPTAGIDTFDDLLSTCETLIAERIDNLVSGQIEPSPLTSKTCDWCPVAVCEKRATQGGGNS